MKRFYKLICVVIISLFCLRATMLNMTGDLYIGGDIGVRGAFPLQTLIDAVNMWHSNEDPGTDNTYSTTYIVMSLFLTILKLIGFSVGAFTKIYFFILLFVSGISAYLLILYVLGITTADKGQFTLHLCGLLGGLFYMFNYFSRMLLAGPPGHLPIVYSIFPLVLLVFMKGLHNVDILYYSILFGILSIFMLSCNLAHVGAALIILFLFFVFNLIITKRFNHSIRFAVTAGLFSFLISNFIILPIFASLTLKQNLQMNIALGWFSPGSWLYLRSNFLNLFRLDGPPHLDLSFKAFIYTPKCILFSYFLPIIAFSSLFWVKKNINILFFIILAIIGLFLAKGVQQPLGQIFLYIGKVIPMFTIFKFSYDKFCMLISIGYAVMVGFSCQQYIKYLIHKFKKLKSALAAVLCITPAFMCISWPFLIGGLGTQKFFPKIPNAYYETADFINSKKGDFKILSLPVPSGSWNEYTWGYIGLDPLVTILNKPVIESYRLQENVFRTLINDKAYREFRKLLRLFNMKYILLRDDLMHLIPALFVKDNILTGKDGINYEKGFEGMDIYKIKREFYRPHIYAGNPPILIISKDTDAIYPICYTKYLKGYPLLFFSNDLDNFEGIIKEEPVLDSIVHFIRDASGKDTDILEGKDRAFIFRGSGEFDVEKDGEYKVKLMASAKPYFGAGRLIINRTMDINLDTKKWGINYNPKECELKKKDGISIFCHENPCIEMSGYLDGVDVKKFPCIKLIYDIKNPNIINDVELILEFDNKKSIKLNNLPVDCGTNNYTANIKKILTYKSYKDGNLLKNVTLKVSLSGQSENNENIFVLKRLILFNKAFKPAGGYILKKPLFDLDGNVYMFGKKVDDNRDTERVLFKRNIFLKKGTHNFRNMIGKNLDFIIFESEDKVEAKKIVVSHKKISSTRYEVKLGTDKPCWLVFSESFDPKWKAYLYSNQKPETRNQKNAWLALFQMWKDRGKRIELKEHYKVNGYANAWYIGKIKNQKLVRRSVGGGGSKIKNKEIKIIIEYIPQRFFEIGCIISVLSLIICIIGVLLIKMFII